MLHVARAQAGLETTIREKVDSGRLPSEQHRMAKVVVEYKRADPQPIGCLGDGDQPRKR